jgi:hypothetical protein
MLPLLQLLLAVFAIYGAINFEEGLRLVIPLGCLIAMLAINRIDKRRSEKAKTRKEFLKTEMEKTQEKDSTAIKDQDFFTLESLLWPKSELLLIDAVHSVLKEMGFQVSAGINYHSVDRIAKIPGSPVAFGVEILMTEAGVENHHPKLDRALKFEEEKREKEKTLIIASTHIRQPLSERKRLNGGSPKLNEFLAGHRITLITAYSLYELWQKSKSGELDTFEVFRKVFLHPGGICSFGENHHPTPPALNKV